jgi:glycosyltransferase involved in cell wall biosynthesis
MAPVVSVHTPSWNRGIYLERVWQGLLKQSFCDFEWIISDDGSSDGTAKVLERIRRESPFPVVTVVSSVRVGKAVLDNNAVRIARGEFFLWCDSDDVLVPEALQVLLKAWDSIEPERREEFVGITALCRTEQEVLQATLPVPGVFDITWNELRFRHKMTGDMAFFCRSDILKSHPFPEVDYVVPEGSVWARIGATLKTRVIPEVVKIVEYRTPNAISFSTRMEYCRGKAHEMALSSRHLAQYPLSKRDELWQKITYLRYCMHGEIAFLTAVKLWQGRGGALPFLGLLPASLLLALKDLAQGRVRRTHREFEAARVAATLSLEATEPELVTAASVSSSTV